MISYFSDNSTLNCFKNDVWLTLGPESRLEALQDLEYYTAYNEGRPARQVIAEAMDYAGYYRADDPTHLHVNQNYLTSMQAGDQYDAMNTVLHEGRHAYQHDIIEGKTVQNESQETASLWSMNMGGGYLGGGKDLAGYLDYRFQPIEDDANVFALSSMESMQDFFKDDQIYSDYIDTIRKNDALYAQKASERYGEDYKQDIQQKVENKYQQNTAYTYDAVGKQDLSGLAQEASSWQGDPPYLGKDDWINGGIPRGSDEVMYQASWHKLDDSHHVGSFFTDRHTIEASMNNGQIDMNQFAGYTQVAPSNYEGAQGTFQPYVNAYSVDWEKADALKQDNPELYNKLFDNDGNLKCAYGKVENNDAFGPGGKNQYYFNDDAFNDGLKEGVFKCESDKSFSEESGTLKRETDQNWKDKYELAEKEQDRDQKTEETNDFSVKERSHEDDNFIAKQNSDLQNNQLIPNEEGEEIIRTKGKGDTDDGEVEQEQEGEGTPGDPKKLSDEEEEKDKDFEEDEESEIETDESDEKEKASENSQNYDFPELDGLVENTQKEEDSKNEEAVSNDNNQDESQINQVDTHQNNEQAFDDRAMDLDSQENDLTDQIEPEKLIDETQMMDLDSQILDSMDETETNQKDQLTDLDMDQDLDYQQDGEDNSMDGLYISENETMDLDDLETNQIAKDDSLENLTSEYDLDIQIDQDMGDQLNSYDNSNDIDQYESNDVQNDTKEQQDNSQDQTQSVSNEY